MSHYIIQYRCWRPTWLERLQWKCQSVDSIYKTIVRQIVAEMRQINTRNPWVMISFVYDAAWKKITKKTKWEQTDGQSGNAKQTMQKVNKRLNDHRKGESQLSGGILPTSLSTHSRVNCQCDEESPVSQGNHIWLVLMGGRLVTGSQETQATLISMPAKRAACVYACLCVLYR